MRLYRTIARLVVCVLAAAQALLFALAVTHGATWTAWILGALFVVTLLCACAIRRDEREAVTA